MSAVNMDNEFVESPCTGVCTLDDAGYCLGCLRTGEEIADWPWMQPDERRQLIDRLAQRKEL